MNNRIVLSSCAAALLSLSVAAAQTTNQTPTQSPVQGSTQGISGQTRPGANTQSSTSTTWTGCVMRAADYTRAHAGANVGAGSQFVLANATRGAGTRSSASAATTPGSGSATTGISGSASTGRDTPAVGTSGVGVDAGVSAEAGATDQAGSRPDANARGEAGVSAGVGDSSATANAGAAGSTAGTTGERAETPTPDAASTAATGANTAATASATGGVAYGLSGSGASELNQHVGKRVEIVGSIEGGVAAGATSQTRGTAMQTINITTVRVVPGTCQ